jgi:hypothetical protein
MSTRDISDCRCAGVTDDNQAIDISGNRVDRENEKQWLAQPPEGADQSLTARLFGEFGKPPASQALLSNEVRNMLEKHSSPHPKPGNN